MSKSSEIAKRVTGSAGEAALSGMIVTLPTYESGPLSTGQLAEHLSYMIENWKGMDADTFSRANGTARSATKYWDTVRGLERLSIERQKLELRAGGAALAKSA